MDCSATVRYVLPKGAKQYPKEVNHPWLMRNDEIHEFVNIPRVALEIERYQKQHNERLLLMWLCDIFSQKKTANRRVAFCPKFIYFSPTMLPTVLHRL